MNRKQKEKRQTPIKDGDARPDMPPDPANKNEEERSSDKKKFEKERMSDLNSLEDYKDAKLKNEKD